MIEPPTYMCDFNIYFFIATLANGVTLNWRDIGGGAVSFSIVVAISFGVFFLIESVLRFHHIILIKRGTDADDPSGEFMVSLIRHVSKLQSNPPPFCLVFISVRLLPEKEDEPIGKLDHVAFLEQLSSFLRDGDDCTMQNDGKFALLIEVDPQRMGAVVKRLSENIATMKFRNDADLPIKVDLRMGGTSFPAGGNRVTLLVERVETALKKAEAAIVPDTWVFDPPLSKEEKDETKEVSGRKTSLPSFIDPSTGLLKADRSRGMVQKFAVQLRREEKPVSILFLRIEDLDRYSRHYGEDVVKTVRVEMSKHLQENLRENDIIGCWEEDSFIIAIDGDSTHAEAVARRLVDVLRKMRVVHESYRLRLGVCIGFATLPEHGKTPRQILRAGQIARQVASEKGHNVSVCFNPDMLARKHVKHSHDHGEDAF